MGFLGGVAELVAIVLAVGVFALAVRRVLGVRVGLLRTGLVAFVAATSARPLLRMVLEEPAPDDDTTTVLLYLLLLGAVTLVLAMGILVVIEVLVPDGSLPGPMEWWRSWRSLLSRTARYLHILRVVSRHGLARFLRGRTHVGVRTSSQRRDLARSLRHALEDAGVTFIKLGQQLSTRRDVLPPEFTGELAALQDDAAPVPWPAARALLEAELRRPLEDVFHEVDTEPLAAASVAQVHTARLLDGSDVVVKVQRPGIGVDVERDLDILTRLAGTLAARTQWGRTIGLHDLVEGFAVALREELDFTIERDNMRSVAITLEATEVTGVRVPRPRADLCTARVLVMERMAGTPLGSAETVLARLGPDRRRAIADVLLEVVLGQLLDSGTFHVDLHPGNLLVQDDGTLAMLDLGSVGRLGAQMRQRIARLLAALGTGDSLAATDALLEVVHRPEEVDERALEQAIGVAILRYTTAGATDGAAAFGALFRLVAVHRLGVPPEVAAVFRAVATLEGTLTAVDPGYDLIGRARALGVQRGARELTGKHVRRTVEEELAVLLPVLRRLPRRVDRLADAVEHGRLSVGVRLLADPRERRFVTRLWHQGLLTVLGATAGLMAAVLFTVGPGPLVAPEVGIYQVMAGTLLAVAVILVLRVLMAVFRRDADHDG